MPERDSNKSAIQLFEFIGGPLDGLSMKWPSDRTYLKWKHCDAPVIDLYRRDADESVFRYAGRLPDLDAPPARKLEGDDMDEAMDEDAAALGADGVAEDG